MSGILREGAKNLQEASLVLSCHTEIPLVRETLSDMNYHICEERLVRAKGRYYIVMRAEPGKKTYTEKELYLGPGLLSRHPSLWREYLQWREGVVSCEIGHETQLNWIREELKNETDDSAECL